MKDLIQVPKWAKYFFADSLGRSWACENKPRMNTLGDIQIDLDGIQVDLGEYALMVFNGIEFKQGKIYGIGYFTNLGCEVEYV